MRVVKSIYVVGGREISGVPADANAYLLLTDREFDVLVDSTSGLAMNSVIAYMLSLGFDVRRIRYVINTHCHVNNAGGSSFLHGTLGALVVAHDPDSRAMMSGDERLTDAKRQRLRFRAVPVAISVKAEEYVLLSDGVTVVILHTPGHTKGSQSVLVEYGDLTVVLVGDALGTLHEDWGSSERDWYSTVDKLYGIEADVLCTSLGCVKGARLVKEYIDSIRAEGAVWLR